MQADKWDDNGLYNFFLKKMPEYKTAGGALDVRTLANDLDASHECVYKWLRKNRLPARRVNAVLGVGAKRISEAELVKFVMNV